VLSTVAVAVADIERIHTVEAIVLRLNRVDILDFQDGRADASD
jgi:hypothetical protein